MPAVRTHAISLRHRRVRAARSRLVGAIAVAWLATLAPLSPAHAAKVVNGTVTKIVGVNGGLCLGVGGATDAAGAPLQSQGCSGSNYQQWKLVVDSAGYAEVVNVGSGKCIDVTGGSTASGTNLQQWNCSGADYQKWNFSDQGNGQFAILSKYNALALQVFEASTANGARIVQSSWANGSHQKWTLPSADSTGVASGSVITLTGVRADKCIGVKEASTASGAGLQSQDCSGAASQQWRALKDAAGLYELVNVGSGLCMDVPGASTAQGTGIQQWGCGGGLWQKWSFRDDGAGHYAITSKSSGLALDVNEASTANGAAIIQWPYVGAGNQQWIVAATGSGNPGGSGASDGPVGFGAGVTGGKGGTVVTVTTPAQLQAALCATSSNGACTDTTPRIVRVSGVIDFRGTEGTKTSLGCTYSHNSCSYKGKSERILNYSSYCSGRKTYDITYDAAGGVPLLVGSNKTLIGVGAASGIKGKGLTVRGGASNVIIRNLSITDINDGIIWAGDAITLDNASKVWIDHNHIARIGRQMIVTGWGTAQNVTISNNDFDGTTDYGHYCDTRHYWVMLLVAENQTITLAGNRIYNTSGRSPEVGKSSSAVSGGIVHIVNNYYDSNYYMGIGASDDAVTLVEGNYYAKAGYFFPIMEKSSNKVFAPLESNLAAANNSCMAVLGRDCVANYDTNSPKDFILNPSAMSTLQSSSAAVNAVKSVRPAPYSTVPAHAVGPQAGIAQ